MFRKIIVGTIVGGLCATAMAQENRVSASQKGSLLAYVDVEVKYDGQGNVVQDTFIELTNDFAAPVAVQMYFVNGDAATADEPGWNWVDNQISLTQDEPSYWAASSGLPKGVSPWSVLDPGTPPGRDDPDDPSIRTIRGFIYAWAVNANGEQIRWNHLTGDAIVINYMRGTAFEYKAYAFQCHVDDGDGIDGPTDNGLACGPTPGELLLDGVYYDYGFNQLILDFYAVGSLALSGGGIVVGVDTDLTLLPISQDLRQDNDGPVTTKAKFDVWNQNEVRFSGMERCVTCWDQALLSAYDNPNHALLGNLQTDKGKARIDGLASPLCDPPLPLPPTTAASLLGVYERQLSFDGGTTYASAGDTMVGTGVEAATIRNDIISPGGESHDVTPTIEPTRIMSEGATQLVP